MADSPTNLCPFYLPMVNYIKGNILDTLIRTNSTTNLLPNGAKRSEGWVYRSEAKIYSSILIPTEYQDVSLSNDKAFFVPTSCNKKVS